jgi:sugar phosphate isomerase/epimerase
MNLGFLTAILPDLSLEEVMQFAAEEGYGCVEVMCWPPGKADRRYAGVTHLDVSDFTDAAASHARQLAQAHGVKIAALGYYPNPLDPDPAQRKVACDHLLKVIEATPKIGVSTVSTFIGRDPALTVVANMRIVEEVWTPIVRAAENAKVQIGIEHCPMIFSDDEWPGGKNVAYAPAVWRELFRLFPGDTLGLTFDPSHLIWLGIDAARALREFGGKLRHVHAKDERIDRERLYEVGVFGQGWHKPKLPGLGDVNWGDFFAALTDTGYSGPVCVEVEDRAYERNLEDRKRALRQSKAYLGQFFG